jgi:hypothetical protein
MRITWRLPIIAAVMALATACTSGQQAESSVQMPGDPARRNGLEVPPDVWAHPTSQTANAIPPQR